MATATRVVRAPRGTSLTCKGWPQEAALRMLMNNLDPEVAERPDDLIVYGGAGKAPPARAPFVRVVATPRRLGHGDTPPGQTGQPPPGVPTPPLAPPPGRRNTLRARP